MQRLIAALLFAPAVTLASEACTVVSVHDGDTLTALCGPDKLKVRLREIDAPERTQPYSRRSTNSLKALCLGKSADIAERAADRFGRTLARVTCNGIDANADQVRRGYAWAFTKYLTDPEIRTLETEAREARRGLWRSTDPVAPWTFRHSTTP